MNGLIDIGDNPTAPRFILANETDRGVQGDAVEPGIGMRLLPDPIRQKLLLALARKPWQPPSLLRDSAGRSLDLTMKRLATMRSDGFVMTKRDAVDTRLRFYALAHGVPLVTTGERAVLDFGFLQIPVNGCDTVTQAGAAVWDPAMICFILREPTRRKIVARLAQTPGQSADQLNEKAAYKIDATYKHLQVMHAAGVLVKTENERDGRRPLYSLAPSIQVSRNGDAVLEFGSCTVRF